MKENYLKLLMNLILILFAVPFLSSSKSMMLMRISGTNNLSKTFVKNSIKGKGWGIDFFNDAKHKTNNDNIFYALNRINIQLDNSVTAFIGPSGCGKSTLAKCLIGKETHDSGEISFIPSNSSIIGAYLDHLFCQTYDQNLTIEQLFHRLYNKYSKEFEVNSSYNDLMAITRLPLNEKISNLLESQRKVFELFYAILQAEMNQLNICNSTSIIMSYIVILDEYLDKDVASVRSNFYRIIKMLSNHPKFQLQVIIITHSKAVFSNYCDRVIVLKDGNKYFEGNPKTATLPNQLQMLD